MSAPCARISASAVFFSVTSRVTPTSPTTRPSSSRRGIRELTIQPGRPPETHASSRSITARPDSITSLS